MTLAERQQKAAHLVKFWSTALFDDGQSLCDYLHVRGWPLWSMIEAEFAVYRIGPSLAAKPDKNLVLLRLKHNLSKLRTFLRPRPSMRQGLGEGKWPSRPAAVFLGFSAYMLRDVLLPVVEELANNSGLPPVVLYDADTLPGSFNGKILNRSLARGQSCPKLSWQWFLTDQARTVSHRAQRTLAKRIRALLGPGKLEAIVQHEGHDLWPLLCWSFESLLRFRLSSLLPIVAAAEQMIDNYPIALLVSPDVADPRIRAFIQLAKARGIPTLEIQFGTCGPESVEWRFFLADILAVWGSRPKAVMEMHGVPSERIVITGSPRHDSLTQPTPASVAVTRTQLGAEPGKTLILFASTHSSDPLCNPGVIRAMKEAVFTACRTLSNVRLTVKPHPLEDVAETRALAASDSNFIFLEPAEDIRPFIVACDIFISTGSTATLDALIADKPVICLNFPGWETFSDLFARSGAALPACSAEETRQTIFALLPSGSASLQQQLKNGRERFVEEWAYSADGVSAARVAAIARRLAQDTKG